MKTRTFTLLVTITDDHPPSANGLARHIASALEMGCATHHGFSAASVDALTGDQTALNADTLPMRNLHAHLRRD